jgi:hypothetical protein
MNNLSSSTRRRRRIALGIVLGTAVIGSLAGAIALREVFARPGEAALRLVPADSIVVASIDLSPSPSQALAFKHIDDSLSRNGMAKYLETSLLEVIDQSKTTEELKPLTLRNGAICVTPLSDKPNDQAVVGFLALTDGPKAGQILQKAGSPLFYKGMRYYKLGKGSTLIMVVDDLLVITDKPQTLLKVKAVQTGEAKSITSLPEFVAARRQVSDDANVMCYLSPNLGRAIMGEKAEGKVPMPEWAAVGLAIRDGGIGVSFAGKMDITKNDYYKEMASIPSVRTDLFDVLPTGSYGMVAVSDPSAYFTNAETAMKNDKDFAKAVADGEDGIQKGTGLSAKQDLIPALKGDAVAALYPSQTGQAAGVDVLVVVDDSNAANPSDAVDRFKTFMEQQRAKEGDAPSLLVEDKTSAGTREYRINDHLQSDMRESFGKGMDPATFKKDLLVAKKTIAYTVVGKAILAATSQDLLDRAVASYESKTNGMTGDSKFSTSEKELLDSHSFATFSLSRIAEGIKNTIETTKMKDKDRKLFSSILGAFESLNDPFYIKGKMSPDGQASCGVFIPLDYDKIVDLIGGQVKK